jgi:hypothetical protein
MAHIDFDAANTPAAEPFAVLPAGAYTLMVTNSDVKPTKAGTGEYVSVEYTVVDGPATNRKIFGNFNIKNPNADAERIGRSELSALCAAVGIGKLNETGELHGKPFRADVRIKKDAEYGDKNEVKGWARIEGAAPVAAPRAAAPAPAAAPARAAPWAKTA